MSSQGDGNAPKKLHTEALETINRQRERIENLEKLYDKDSARLREERQAAMRRAEKAERENAHRLNLYTLKSNGVYLPAIMIVVAADEEKAKELVQGYRLREGWDFEKIDLDESAVHVLDDRDY